MKLPEPFVRLPLCFDVRRLREELRALPADAWAVHPTGFQGNSAARLISLGGGENDETAGGQMAATRHLQQSPYIQQVLASFGTVWSRSRLMKLQPGATVPEHADINYHWFNRVRVHIPIDTLPGVRFHCGGEQVHMGAGEAWIFDNWRSHRVENPTAIERVHLVADTTGSAGFWRLVEEGRAGAPTRSVPFVESGGASLAFERFNSYSVMPPAEVDQLFRDLIGEGVPKSGAPRDQAGKQLDALLDAFCRDWRQLWSLHADLPSGQPQYRKLIEAFRRLVGPLAMPMKCKTNGSQIMGVINARLQFAIEDMTPSAVQAEEYGAEGGTDVAAKVATDKVKPQPVRTRFDRPLFIVAAPRSGSTALFETLACTPQVWTVGGEAHALVEGFPQLRPGSDGVDSNRLGPEHVTPELIETMHERFWAGLVDPRGQPLGAHPGPVRTLEKTPKNSLRIPLFERVFADARYIFLWRDPHENISSIIEAWKSGGWVTYPRLAGWNGPWSLLLPPGWQSLKGLPLQEIAAYQWAKTNRIVMEDLSQIPKHRWTVVHYSSFVADPGATTAELCRFADLKFDQPLQQRTGAPLPLSRHTHTAPKPEKWRANASVIEPILDRFEPIWSQLKDFR